MALVKKVLIVGGGIGGLSLGIGLRKQGIEAEIVEIQQEYKIYGSGIIQQANALRALDALGVADEAMEKGYPYAQVKMCTGTGFEFAKAGPPPIGRFPSHNGISRRTLHEILYNKAKELGVVFRMGTSVVNIENKADEAEVHFTDETKGTYGAVVAADGIYSKVRELIFGKFEPRYVNASVWRYTFKRPKDLETGYMYMGKKAKVGLIPTTKDTIYMFVVSMEGDSNPHIPKEELVPRLSAYLDEFNVPFVKEIQPQITDPNEVNYRPLEVMTVPAPWYKNRVIMIGDAAHATVPQLGSGAALAIEDAVVLAEELGKDQSVEQAFEKHMARRYNRCKAIVDASETLVEWEKLEFSGQKLPEGANLGALIGKSMMILQQPI
jgi:2-polyprenyl-6-methoxyphenol hydroxylase-like FAD-dependent oxidoreductase